MAEKITLENVRVSFPVLESTPQPPSAAYHLYETFARKMRQDIADAFTIPFQQLAQSYTSAAESMLKFQLASAAFNGPSDYIGGTRIVYSEHVTRPTWERLFPYSRHRSTRVEKKLVRRYGGVYRRVPAIFAMGNTIYAHPSFRAEIEERLRADNPTQ